MVGIPLVIEPDPEDPDCASVMVDAAISGRPYRFILDTGAARSQIVADDYTRSLPRSGTHDSAGVFSTSSQDVVVLEELACGWLTAARLEVSLLEDAGSHHLNLLGMDVLQHHACHFRFDVGELTEGVRAGGWASESRALRTDAGSHPYVDVAWPGVTAQAVWDSGAAATIVDRGFWSANRALFAAAGTSVGVDSSGAQVEATMCLVTGAAVGGRTFAPHRAAVVDLSGVNATVDLAMDMILGYPTLRQVNWLFDFPSGRWAITQFNP